MSTAVAEPRFARDAALFSLLPSPVAGRRGSDIDFHGVAGSAPSIHAGWPLPPCPSAWRRPASRRPLARARRGTGKHAARVRVHRGFPELLGIHFAQSLEAADRPGARLHAFLRQPVLDRLRARRRRARRACAPGACPAAARRCDTAADCATQMWPCSISAGKCRKNSVSSSTLM